MHIHKYIRIKVGRNKRIEFKCALDGCVHKIREEYAPGRISLCNRCGKEFLLDKDNIRLAKPHCIECTKTKKLVTVPDIIEVMQRLEGEGNENA